ncbi:heterokaryon incompatibility protein-domain-containing protein [Astrocystis sublimbata]|nr:heterokaryon incompatibility protein-domain-containing protein [Astrocystis sublimbata]
MTIADKIYWVVKGIGQQPGKRYSRDSELYGLRLQRFDDESLSKIGEFQYQELPKTKKRIRLLVLKSASQQTSQIDCELIEADYGNRFHIPTRPVADPKEPRSEESPQKQQSPQEDELRRLKEEEARLLSMKIDYEALSWCWGTGNEDYAIRIEQNGTVFKKKIREELALALRFLRYAHEPRTIWVDSVCIDQRNYKERGHQVQMMSRIYTRAKSVCVWLGIEDEDSHMAINFIKDEILELKNFDTICSDKKYAQKWKSLMMLMQRSWFSRRWMIQEISLAQTAIIHCGPSTINWNDFAVAVELFVEVENATHRLSEVMQKDEKFLHIPGLFEHVSELGASLLVQATGKVFRTQSGTTTGRDSATERDSQTQTGAEADMLLRNPNNLIEVSRESKAIDPLERRSLLSLQYLVTTMYIFQTSEPRDVVYSLLAVARDASPSAEDSILSDPETALLMRTGFSSSLEAKPFNVDYSKAYSDVCRDFVEFSIRRTHYIDPIQALDVLCRPWALEAPTAESARLNKERKKENNREIEDHRSLTRYKNDSDKRRKEGNFWLRPWTANKKGEIKNLSPFDDTPQSKILFRELQAMKDKHFPASDPEKTSDNFQGPEKDSKIEDMELPSWVASARSAPFDLFYHAGSIDKTGRINADPLVGAPVDGYRNYNAAQAQHLDLEAVKFRKRLACKHYSLYVKGFIFDEVDEVRDASQNGYIPESWITLGNWRKPEKYYPPDSFWRTLVGDRGKDNQNPPYYFARACRESAIKGGLRSGGINTRALIDNEQNSIIAEFCRRAQAVIWSRRLFKTKKGILGLGPMNVKVGDQVGIIYGCTVPVILRRGNKDRTKWRETNDNMEEEAEAEIEDTVQRAKEEFEDSVEALKVCVKRLHELRLRRLRFVNGDRKLDDEVVKTRNHYNETRKKEWEAQKAQEQEEMKKKKEEQDEIEKDKNGETAEEEQREVSKMVRNQMEAAKEDPYLHYQLIGDSYVHGMMDGEALRRKFYEDIPDRTFELR